MNAKKLIQQPKRLILLVMIPILATTWVQAPRLLDAFKVDEDFRSFYWMNKFQDEDLFQDDPLVSQIGCRQYETIKLFGQQVTVYFYSPGYSGMFLALSHIVTPMLLSKLIPFMLTLFMTCYLFKYGRSLENYHVEMTLAIGFVLLNLASPTSISVANGLPRGFACPLMIALLYYLHHRKRIGSFVVSTMGALIYPPMFPLALATWGLSITHIRFVPKIKVSIALEHLPALLAAFLVGILILAPVLLPTVSQALGTPSESASSAERIWEKPRYRAGGRQPLFYLFPILGRAGLVNKGLNGLHLLILVCFSCLIVVLKGAQTLVPKEPLCLLWASLILFGVAWGGIYLTDSLILYLPSRYTRVGLPIFFSMFVLVNGPSAIREASEAISKHRRSHLRWLVGVEAALLLLVLLSPHTIRIAGISMKILLGIAGVLLAVLTLAYSRQQPHAFSIHQATRTATKRGLQGVFLMSALILWGLYARAVTVSLNPSQEKRDLLRFVEKLPKDTMLAGYPCALDDIPLLARRKILFGCENYNTDVELTRDALGAYYAGEASVVRDFCAEYDVDYLVIDREAYSEEYLAEGWVFYEPYNTELLDQIANRETFVLEQIPDGAKMFQAGDYYVVPCNEDTLPGETPDTG